jgi:hypothetical protein
LQSANDENENYCPPQRQPISPDHARSPHIRRLYRAAPNMIQSPCLCSREGQ